MDKYDIAVLGGGPGGYVAAIKAAKLGCSVALIEAEHLGGTCLNRGCIPSKTLLRYAEVLDLIEKAKSWGIETGQPVFSFDRMMQHKDQVIHRLRTGIASLLKAGRITHYQGYGRPQDAHHISIQLNEEEIVIHAEYLILATGSRPFLPPIPGTTHTNVQTSDTIFTLKSLPPSIVIVGGGVIGVEFACIFSSLGVEVSIVELADRILPSEDEEAAKILTKQLQKNGVRILTSSRVIEMKVEEQLKILTIKNGDRMVEIQALDVLMAVGRRANTEVIDQLGLELRGEYIAVNQYQQTNRDNIYAVGDVIGGWQLAHVASAEGLIAAHNIALELGKIQGEKQIRNERVIPRCIYTHPEIAAVGLSEQEARAQGLDVKVEIYYHIGNGKALTLDEKEGFVKLIAERKHGEILGVIMVGPHVTELISEASAFIFLEGTVEEMAQMVHPHPSIAETMCEVANAWLGQGIHR